MSSYLIWSFPPTGFCADATTCPTDVGVLQYGAAALQRGAAI
jgi:hypothetical protein